MNLIMTIIGFDPEGFNLVFSSPLFPRNDPLFLAKLRQPSGLPLHCYDTASAASCVTFDLPIRSWVFQASSGELSYPGFPRRRLTGYRSQKSDQRSSSPNVS